MIGLKERAQRAHRELSALSVALADSRTPVYARVVAGLTLGLALSPVDIIPDFIPVLGYLDDIIVIPIGIYLSRLLIPKKVLGDARIQAEREGAVAGGYKRLARVLVVLLWIAVAAAVALLIWGALGRPTSVSELPLPI